MHTSAVTYYTPYKQYLKILIDVWVSAGGTQVFIMMINQVLNYGILFKILLLFVAWEIEELLLSVISWINSNKMFETELLTQEMIQIFSLCLL